MKIIFLFTLIFVLTTCSDPDNDYYCPPDTDPLGNNPYGAIFSIDGCKSAGGIIQGFCSQSEEGFSFTYFPNDKILYFNHVNSAFNCEPGKISAKIDISNSIITIEESQEKSDARCNCLYDIAYDLRHIEPKVYLITFVNPICKSMEAQPLSFYIDLTQDTKGEFTIFRGFYPWDE